MVEYPRMTETPDPTDSEPASQGGVFGNLPDARPGTRSPRRASAKKTAAKPAAKAKAKSAPKAKAAAKPPPPPPRAPATPRPVDPERPLGDQQPGGLADIAWAGVAVAAEAATIGVRLASRAIEAVRGNPEKD
jgi:hypothetical protein